MPEIGATLREARQRRKVDLYKVETDTKIRAKYLHALEDEEWDQLPGPTYVKTFLRTYGTYLGLDAALLVEEYKQRFERPGPQELTPFSTKLGSRRERRRARGPIISPGIVVGVCLLILIGVLAAIGILWNDPASDRPVGGDPSPTPAATATPRAAASSVRVRITARDTVTVCLLSRTGARLVDGEKLRAGRSRSFRGRRFTLGLGNGAVRLRVGDRTVAVPRTSRPVGYDIRASGRTTRLRESRRPRCA